MWYKPDFHCALVLRIFTPQSKCRVSFVGQYIFVSLILLHDLPMNDKKEIKIYSAFPKNRQPVGVDPNLINDITEVTGFQWIYKM